MSHNSQLTALIESRLDVSHVLSIATHLNTYEQKQFRKQLWAELDRNVRGQVSTPDMLIWLALFRARVGKNDLGLI